MATKPKATSTAVAIKKSSAMVSIKEALAAQAAAMADRVAPSTGISIKTASKKFALPDGTKSEGPMEFVVLDFVARYEFYEVDYDKDNIVPPTCFAIGLVPNKLVPSANAPQKQSDDCASCPMNAFGSKGKGKACNNTRLLAVLPPDATKDTPIYLLKVSPTGLKSFDGFVQKTARAGLAPIEVVVTVDFDEDQDYPKLVFGDTVPNELVGVHFARQAEARELLNQEPDTSSYVAPAPAKKGRAPIAARR